MWGDEFSKSETMYIYIDGICIHVREEGGRGGRVSGEIVCEWAILTCQGELLATVSVQNLTHS